jgi:exoribonuclease R
MAKTTKRVANYTLDNLRDAVSLQPDVVSLQAIARSFDIKERGLPALRAKLQQLINEGSITSSKTDRYESKRPLSTLVVARVKQSLNNPGAPISLKNETKLPLSIEGLPEDFPFPITVTGRLLRKKFGKATILPSERMAVVVNRRHGAELVVTKIIDKFKVKKLPTIVGHFAKNARVPTFIPYTPGLNKTFNVYGKIPRDINPKISFIARVPLNLDPYTPSLEISEQKWDPDTGIPIASIIANKHGIRPGHDKPAMREAKKVTRQHTPFLDRRDLTQEKILVIDPADARDHDDGILIERTRDGYRTLVVVPDVPHFVRPGSALDKVAREKAFTHYFPDDTFHMLPHRLVHHASLKEGRSKPVIYMEQFWDENYDKIGYPQIGLGVIAAQKQLSYGQMEDLVIDRSPNITSYLELGDALVERMRHEKITFENDNRNRRYSYSEMLVASMMIDANAAFAEYLLNNNIPFLSRSHTGVDNVFAFAEIKMKLEEWGYDVPNHIADMNYEGLRAIIAQAEERKDRPRVEAAIRSDFLNQATYSVTPFSHFGLNLRNYGHFTSPIRRYGDILGLRGIHTSLGNHELGMSEADVDTLGQIATHLNIRQDISHRVSLDVQKYYAIRDLQRMEGCHVKAMLGKIDPFKVEIILDQKYGLRKQLDISTLPEGWVIGNNGKSLIFNDNIKFAVGHHIRIKIGNVRPHMGDWDIHSMEPTFVKAKAPASVPQMAFA